MTTASDRNTLSTSGYHFIDEDQFERLLHGKPDRGAVRDVIAKSLAKVPLEPEETAVLLCVDSPELVEEIFDAARQLKRDVYGNRIVLFAPLYVGSYCRNDCLYCAFRSSNQDVVRHTLSPEELTAQVETLEKHGHKRLILVFGEHPAYGPEFMADCVKQVYATRVGHGEIRRVNINAAPLDHAGYALMKEAGIGTYQVFQETYHRATYATMHAPESSKGDYLWRLDSPARAIESECDDVGIGALFGLYKWQFEVLSLVAHSRHLQKHYGRRASYNQLPSAASCARCGFGRLAHGQRPRFSASSCNSPARRAVHGADSYGPRDSGGASGSHGFWRFPDRCGKPD